MSEMVNYEMVNYEMVMIEEMVDDDDFVFYHYYEKNEMVKLDDDHYIDCDFHLDLVLDFHFHDYDYF